ncbi:hypothetical protein HMPREF2141_02464 [Bacteroides uniformis]|uniref:Uncharacterized protein n=1 Tax=Phocaeicola plebeius (strain DSM 17135 / JCM 12973 / CCUG 54634 / M2) TaxID=484018 RepID=B5D0N1_PHOPM|nr:hypothetical protein BACPLE_02558 [Phocaeicola plebeius DSM 17135]KXT33604.1 hypothetical protein HMPREF2534_03647 [Bacteroides thetaiotaomicron]KXT34084.1 hypothetical protein HMPREF2141_02464 [Bacteroides uniformis]
MNNLFIFSLLSEAFRLLPSGFDFYVHQRLPFREKQARNLGRIL